jgi:hypothetical protein
VFPQSSRRWRRFAFVGMALYALFLVTSPFEHHDLQCELRTPLHCTACAASALGSDVQNIAVIGVRHLDDVGSAVTELIVCHGRLLDVRTNGRSPPAFS